MPDQRRKYPPPDIEYLLSRLEFDVESGTATWKDATKHHRNLVGTIAGSVRKCSRGFDGYWHIKLDGTPYRRSALVYYVATGKWPDGIIDHINGNTLDDRFENLREVSTFENAWNHADFKRKANLPIGVKSTKEGKFIARITHMKRQIYIGLFETQYAASEAYLEKRKELFGDYARY